MRFRKMTADYRLSQRWFPKGSMRIEHPEGLGEVYVSQLSVERGYWQAVSYRGTAGKASNNYSFKTRELAENFVTRFFESLTEHQKRVAEYRNEANKPHTLKVGDIITNSWGYDQTNVDWYRITRTTEHFVWIKPIAAHVEETSFMAGQSVPHVDASDPDSSKWGFQDRNEPEEKHKASGEYVSMKYGSGSKWDGKPRYCSWYA